MRSSMANMPRILTSNVVVPTSRVGVFSSAAKAEGVPVEEIDQYSALVNQEASIYYDKLLDEKDLNDGLRQKYFEGSRRSIKTALISGTTDSFAQAFSDILTYENAQDAKSILEHPQTSMANAIGTYEATSRVINYELAPIGESMNVSI